VNFDLFTGSAFGEYPNRKSYDDAISYRRQSQNRPHCSMEFQARGELGAEMQKRPLSIERITDDNQRILRLRDQDAGLIAAIESGRETCLVGGARPSAFRWRRDLSERKAGGAHLSQAHQLASRGIG
jgi:hypothetical protein